MKIFAFLTLLVSATMFFAFSHISKEKQQTSAQNPDRAVMVSVQHLDGTTTEIKLPSNHTLADLPQFENVMGCVYVFSTGECRSRAENCEDARAMFAACACEAGHTSWCVVAQEQ
jgi:hypothetical protein